MEFSKQFVCESEERATVFKHVNAPLFRKSINVEGNVKSAEITVCGLGFYELFVNGERITDSFLSPYISNPDHIIYYNTYKLDNYIKNGENVIGIMLGDGFQNEKTLQWEFQYNVFNSSPKLALDFKLETDTETVCYDARDFVCKKGPITFNDLRMGIWYDARLEDKGWNDVGYVESDEWHEPQLTSRPRGRAKLREAEPIVVKKELKPISIVKGEMLEAPTFSNADFYEKHKPYGEPPSQTGGYIFDFGENNAGIFRLKIKGERGQRIDIQCAERLTDGAVDYRNLAGYPQGYCQRDIYILSGDGEEIFEPMFTYHGFRYLYVSGITEEQATEDLLTYVVMSSDLEERGDFECSNELSNKIFDAARRSDISNFYYFQTDCPHREKNGWTGDINVSAEQTMMILGAENSWREWLNNVRLSQNEEGQLPGIIPTDTWGYEWGRGPNWDAVVFTLPYIVYKYRGETDLIVENAHMMIRYLDCVSKKRDERGIIAFGLGDWCQVNRKAHDYTTPLGFTDTVAVIDMCKKAEEMFAVVGLDVQREFAKRLGAELRETIRREYIDFAEMTVKGYSQTGQAMAIFYDIFDNAEKQTAVKRLVEIIENDGRRMTTGVLGLRVLFHVLAQYGEAELAQYLIERTDCASYGYWIEKKKMTLPEQFSDYTGTYPLSENHYFFGDVIQWYMRYPGGINVENCRTVKIKPHFLTNMDYVRAEHILPSGKISVNWKRDGDKIILDVECPSDVNCEILLNGTMRFAKTGLSYSDECGKGLVIINKKSQN